MSFRVFTDPQKFMATALPYWRQQPIWCNLMWGLTRPLLSSPEISEEDNGGLLMLAHQVGTSPWFILRTDTQRPANLVGETIPDQEAMIEIRKLFPDLKGINAHTELAYAFANAYGRPYSLQNNLLVYKLSRMRRSAIVGKSLKALPGELRLAISEDLEIATQWTEDFIIYIKEVGHQENYEERARSIIAAEQLYFYCLDGQPVSMAGSTRREGGVAVINYVFTPEEWRGRGFATACVGALCDLLLKDYGHCMLYAEADNPASNAVYLKLGFEAVGDALELIFEE